MDWDAHVLSHFPLIGELNHPWRWANAGAPELGRWLLDCRRMLLNGNAIDLRQVPAEVTWVPLRAETVVQQRLTAALTRAVTANGQVLVIGNSYDTRGRQQMASQTPGATTVEAVDLVDLTDFGAAFNLDAADALTRLVQFAAGVMTQVGPAALLPRLETLRRGRARNPPTVAEAALVAFAERPGFTLAAEALRLLTRQDNARVYRPEVLRCCLRALQSAAAGGCTFADATIGPACNRQHIVAKGTGRGGGSHHIPGRDGCTTPLCRYDAGIFAAGCVLANSHIDGPLTPMQSALARKSHLP